MSDRTTRYRQEPDTGYANRLVVREWRPTAAARGVFLLLHGMESNSTWWSEVASQLVGLGWAVVAYDRSGWGGSMGVRGHLATYRDFLEEASGMAVSARKKYGSVHLAGMSWGGMAAMYLALRRGWLFDSLSLIAPGLHSIKDVDFGGKLLAAINFLRKRRTAMVRPLFQPGDFTHDPEWRHFIDTDPERIREVSVSFCIETLKMRRFCREMAGRRLLPPSLCLLAKDDVIIDNGRVRDVCRKAGMRVEEFSHAGHSLVFDDPEGVAGRLAAHAASSGRAGGRRSRVWVVGGGAVGGGVGALLSFGGHEVGMLVKPKYEADMRRSGITLQSGHGLRVTGRNLVCASDTAALPPDPGLVVLAVKSFDSEAALASLVGRIPVGAVIASLQNGIGNEAKIAEYFPGHTIVAGSICAGLELSAPGRISWPDDRGGVAGAVFLGDGEKARAAWLDVFTASGMETRWIAGERAAARLKWSKLMLNIGFNALNSVTGLTSAQLLQDPNYGCLAVRALREGFALMKALSLEPVDLPGFSVSKLSLAIKAPLRFARKMMAFEAARTSEASFSMRQDRLYKRQHTEIKELNGIIVELGREAGIRTPANRELLEMVEKFS